MTFEQLDKYPKNSKVIFMKKKNQLAVTDYEHVLWSLKSLIGKIREGI